jgi:hypothetical protein
MKGSDNSNGADEQFDLFATPPPKKLARNSDPVTSKIAAIHVIEFSGNHHKKIYSALVTMKDGTFYEIADTADLQPASVWRRLNELEKKGRIYPTGEHRRGPTGRLCRVWRIKK